MRRVYILLLFIFTLNSIAFTQVFDTKFVQLTWLPADTMQVSGLDVIQRPFFENAIYPFDNQYIPAYSENILIYDNALKASVLLKNITTEKIDLASYNLQDIHFTDTNFSATATIKVTREQPLLHLHINTLRRSPETNEIERLVSFEREVILTPDFEHKDGQPTFANNSVLADGTWYKIRVSQSGMYRISHSELQSLGINPATVDPRNIRIYSNGGGILPEPNSAFRHDDLVENPIIVVGEEDGIFNNSDYIIFYAEGPLKWNYNASTGYFRHQTNYYDDYSYLFITADKGQGKRVQTAEAFSSANEIITDFLDYQLHEQELVNLSNTGRTWYGELFDATLSRDFVFNFPNIVTSKQAWIETQVAGRTFGAAAFQLSINGQLIRTMNIDPTQATGYDYAKGNQANMAFDPAGEELTVQLKFNRSLNSARGWLDFVSVNAWRNLVYSGPQMVFSNHRTGEQSIFEYRLSNANNQVEVFEITDPTNIVRMYTTAQANNLSFRADGKSARSFIAFETSALLSPEIIGEVENQNLHAVRDIDYLIISHPDFLPQAERLADFHRQYSNLDVFVTIPELIYNEFSSGSQDVTAIRDFAYMLYNDSRPGKKLKYMLLFGDASFDYKDRLINNTNFVPTYETITSLNLVNSIATDDYYGYLDPSEGGSDNSLLDIGIGRLPVGTIEEAEAMVDKIISYVDQNDETHGPWRNEITLVADDGDSNQHLRDAETLSGVLKSDYPEFNLTKLYLDAYPQIATPSGQKAPAVNDAINKKMDQGTLIMNYSGHGGEVGWTEERILEISDILSWRNRNKLAVFITATCEFSRYDDPTRRSAGEMVFMNGDGGAIAMFTTARATYASTNLRLNRAIFQDNIFTREDGAFPRFGDVIRKSKLTGDFNDRKFVLLGDPALKIAFPRNKVITTHINNNAVGTADTLKALDQVSIRGFVADENGNIMPDFNGKLYATIYDKASTITTNGDQNPVTNFSTRNSIIYKGLVGVTNGSFELLFMMPKDISYRFGTGRISYYATNLEMDAQGTFEDFQIGGFSNNIVEDSNGPVIRLFMGDTTFKNGDFTSENPVLIAMIADESGINTTGAGIGHDITATISGATEDFAILNDYYAASMNKSAEGMIRYPLFNLNPGKHTLVFKAWDILNNSSTAEISFEVIPKNQVTIDALYNYPNPFTDETWFVFSHNQSNEVLDVVIEIYSSSGQLMHRFDEKNLSGGVKSTPIRWDGRMANGQRIPKGLYIYRLIVTNKDGQKTDQRAKLLNYR